MTCQLVRGQNAYAKYEGWSRIAGNCAPLPASNAQKSDTFRPMAIDDLVGQPRLFGGAYASSDVQTLRVLAKAIEAGGCLTDLQVPRHSDTQLIYMALAIFEQRSRTVSRTPYSNDGHPIRTRLVNTILQKKIEGCHQSEDMFCKATTARR